MRVRKNIMEMLKMCTPQMGLYEEHLESREGEGGLDINVENTMFAYDKGFAIFWFYHSVTPKEDLRAYAIWCSEQCSHLRPSSEAELVYTGSTVQDPEEHRQMEIKMNAHAAWQSANNVRNEACAASEAGQAMRAALTLNDENLTERDVVEMQVTKLIELLNK